MIVKGKAVEVEVVAVVVAVAVGERKLWPAICLRENLRVVVIATVGIATAATVVIPPLVVMVEALVTVSPQL